MYKNTSPFHDTCKLLENIQYDLQQTHDLKNAHMKMHEISMNPKLMLTPAQRGLLEWEAIQHHSTEESISAALSKVLKNTPSTGITTPLDLQIQYKITKLTDNMYNWFIVYGQGKNQVQVDASGYKTELLAKEMAKKFISELQNDNEKAWITFGITTYSQNTFQTPEYIQLHLLQIGSRLYILILLKESNIGDSEELNRKTIVITDKLLNLGHFVNPKWVARGNITTNFYILYKMQESELHNLSIQDLIGKLLQLKESL